LITKRIASGCSWSPFPESWACAGHFLGSALWLGFSICLIPLGWDREGAGWLPPEMMGRYPLEMSTMIQVKRQRATNLILKLNLAPILRRYVSKNLSSKPSDTTNLFEQLR
jgi:hypothetical protein